MPDQRCQPGQRAAEKYQTPARLFLALEEDKNTQSERKRGENLTVRAQRVTWPVGMNEHGIANATPRPCPIARDSRTDSPQDEGGGRDDKYGQEVDRKEVVPPSHPENASVNVIHARRLRIHRRAVDCATVQNIVCDGSVIGLINRVHRRQERGRTQDDDDRDDDHVDPAGLTSRHR